MSEELRRLFRRRRRIRKASGPPTGSVLLEEDAVSQLLQEDGVATIDEEA